MKKFLFCSIVLYLLYQYWSVKDEERKFPDEISRHMEIGATPYPQMSRIDPYATAPLVVTVSDDEWNYVVFLLQDGKPITNFYLHSLAKHTVYVRPGRYQLVTLRGRGWDPEKKMPTGFKGGFDRVNWWLIESDLIVPEAGGRINALVYPYPRKMKDKDFKKEFFNHNYNEIGI